MQNIVITSVIVLLLSGYTVQPSEEVLSQAGRKTPGRVLQVEEVYRIEDGQGDFYFKSPHTIQISPDGCLYLVDEDQFLKFGPDGQFIKNLYRKGQGPGEFEGISDFVITNDSLIVLQRQPDKLVIMSHEGEFIREFKPEKGIAKLLAFAGGSYLTARYSTPKFDKVGDEPVIIEVGWTLGYVADDGTVEEPDLRFPTRWYAKRLGGRAMIADHIAEFIAKPYKNKYLILSHSEEYRLKLFDLERKQIVKEFSRDYKRVRYKQDNSGRIEIRPEVFRLAPPVEDLNDIQQVFILGERILVMTSTIESQKGLLVDVFNIQGEYVDHFYLPFQKSVKAEGLEGLPIAFHEDSLYIAEYDEDEIPSIVKYRVKPPL